MIKIGETYIFKKSGNEVRAIAPALPYGKQPMWEVERTKATSAGKLMDVPERALVPVEEWNGSHP
ncbi:hypothetical protein R6242_16150 [Iodobacter sp. CM08]|uniref:hypothetical protein n=1 Tax=Iodobacter sp. CM08 TaxID=3085902 RepID=UPI00298151D5|nr:hypothetical protein [Iodobacter sp. CM08]MDW5418099.1 hypothetical protein [Iodobacter sp. CM08]